MASIVKVPKNNTADYDFIAFSFDGKHSIEDFGIYRVSDGNTGYNIDLSLSSEDKTATVPGMDGKYYFGTQKKEKIFNIKIAFDEVTEHKMSQMRNWLSTDKIADLWFAEAPHKVYSAKVTGLSTIASIVFDDPKLGRVYKGTGTIQFTCYCPYARTPDWVYIEIDTGGTKKTPYKLPGMTHLSYQGFSNYEKIKTTLPLYGVVMFDENGDEISSMLEPSPLAFGDRPFYFVAKLVPVSDPLNIEVIADITGEQYVIQGGSQTEINGTHMVYVQDNVIEDEVI
jgi:hypothetical protein